MAAISETLRQARLRSGFDLDRLAAKTKINHRYLEAIETGDFDKLPSGIFARMFIKQYADAVGLDGASFAEEYQRSLQFGGYSAPEVRSVPEPRSTASQAGVPSFSFGAGDSDRMTSALSSLIWVVAAILVCAGVYYGLAHLPARTVVEHRVETPAPAPIVPAKAAAPTPEAPAQASPAPDASVAPPVAPAADTAIQLSITAIEPVWVTAIADGKQVLAETVAQGATKSISAAKAVRLKLGNAGNVDIVFNGKKLEPFGSRGQVRTVDFTTWGAQVVSRNLSSKPEDAAASNPDPLR